MAEKRLIDANELEEKAIYIHRQLATGQPLHTNVL